MRGASHALIRLVALVLLGLLGIASLMCGVFVLSAGQLTVGTVLLGGALAVTIVLVVVLMLEARSAGDKSKCRYPRPDSDEPRTLPFDRRGS